ncbi:hypothetical protein EZH22_11005 [Xanthobacter dioxanivorans]|uniref:Uncharacterized protein n=1 Tax=Xanthobacter dioxanivorans TaxID=2528964 RepID=A0A974PS29_9HYPH|nr:hypothetical protein [Xanthobacter dioxanivorans]QRG08757.1 hypothetical protein EZH22_11005 [Xanthobacter dioxanivorans]
MLGDARPVGKGRPRAGEMHGVDAAPGRPQPAGGADDAALAGHPASARAAGGRPLPPELRPFVGHLTRHALDAAATRARRIGVGADEVLVAQGAIEGEAATRRLAAHLGLPVAVLGPQDAPADAAMAAAVIRTGVLLESAGGGGRPAFTMAARGREVRRLFRALRADAGLARRARLVAPAALRRHVLATTGKALAERAVAALAAADPLKSAATLRPARTLAAIGLCAGLPLAGLLALAPDAGVLAVQALLSLLFLSWIALRIAGSLFLPPDDERPSLRERDLPVYSILVPLYREAASVPGLVASLSGLDYPALGSKRTTNDGVCIGWDALGFVVPCNRVHHMAADPQVLTTLRRKRDTIEAYIGTMERQIADARRDLSAINATIRLYEIDPTTPGVVAPYAEIHRLFRRGEMTETCRQALRQRGPLDTRELALEVIRTKGMDESDRILRKTIALRIVQALRLQERRGGGISGDGRRCGVRLWTVPQPLGA